MTRTRRIGSTASSLLLLLGAAAGDAGATPVKEFSCVQDEKLDPPQHQLCRDEWGWSLPQTGVNERPGRGKTNHAFVRRTYIKQAVGQGGGADGLRVYSPGAGDAVGRATEVRALAPTNAGGDEGGIGFRTWVGDWFTVPTGKLPRAIRRSDQDLELSLPPDGWAATGEDNWLVFPDASRPVRVVRYRSPLWTLAGPAPLSGAGLCFALDGSAYSDGVKDVYEWLPIVPDASLAPNQIRTRYLAQGREMGAPGSMYSDHQASPAAYRGAGRIAPCERIRDFRYPRDPHSGRWQGGRGRLQIDPAQAAHAAGERFEIHTGGPPHWMYGGLVMVSKRRGSTGAGFAVVSQGSEPLTYGLAAAGYLRDGRYGVYRGLWTQNAQHGWEHIFDYGPDPDATLIRLRAKQGFGDPKHRFVLLRWMNDGKQTWEYDTAQGVHYFNQRPVVTASGDPTEAILLRVRSRRSCTDVCRSRGMRCDAADARRQGQLETTTCQDTAGERWCACY